MVELKKLTDRLQAAGNPVEVTRKGKYYYVLHITKSGMPVPLIKTEDRNELQQYIESEFKVRGD